MKLKKSLCVLASLFAVAVSASANSYVFPFYLNGAGASPPNNSPGVASGTITITDPDVMTLAINYSGLSSYVTQISFSFSYDVHYAVAGGFNPGGYLPPSGNWNATTDYPVGYTAAMLESISEGTADLQVGTLNYPYALSGEIGGFVNTMPAPEPSGTSLMLLAGVLGSAYRLLRRPRASRAS